MRISFPIGTHSNPHYLRNLCVLLVLFINYRLQYTQLLLKGCAFMEGRPLIGNEFYDVLIGDAIADTDEFRHRDKLLLGLACMVGLREIELSQLTVGLFVAPTGELNEFVILPLTITYDGFDRPIALSDRQLQKWFEAYLTWLIEIGVNAQPGKSYLGLNPNAPLFVTDHYKPFSLQSRGRVNLSPYQMNRHLDKLIKKTVLWDQGVRRKSFIRTCTIMAYKADMGIPGIMRTTGQGEETIKNTLAMDYSQYDFLFGWFDKRADVKAKKLASFKKLRKYMI